MQDQRNGIDEREDEMEIDLGLLFAGNVEEHPQVLVAGAAPDSRPGPQGVSSISESIPSAAV